MLRTTVIAVFVALLVPAVAAALPPRYDVEPVPAEPEVFLDELRDMNDAGAVTGTVRVSNLTRAFRQTESGGMEVLGTLPAPFNWGSMGYGISDQGHVVGVSYRVEGSALHGHAFRYHDSEGMVDLGTLGGTISEARAVTSFGGVTGYSSVTPGEFDYHAFLFIEWWGGMLDLGVLPGAWGSMGYDVNICLQVAGESGGRPFLWTPGSGMFEIPVPGVGGAAYSLNDMAHTVGYYSAWEGDENRVRAFLFSWSEGVIDLGVLPGTSHSVAQYVNNAGVVVGFCLDEMYQQTRFIWTREDGMRPLDSAINPMSEANIFDIRGLNNRGELLAHGAMPSQSAGMMRLMPVAASDLNFDHQVDLTDFAIFSGCFGLNAAGAGCSEAAHMLSDLDGNQQVDLNDFAMFSSEFGQ